MGYAYTSKRDKQGEETKQLKKKEKEVQRQKAERKNPERVIKVNEWEKIYKREGESTEIRQWMKEKTGGGKKDTYWCQMDSNNQTQGLHGSKGPLPGKKEVM